MSPEHRSASTRCGDIRQRLEEFAARRLGPVARGEVQGHLLECQRCSEKFGELLLEQVRTGELPLLTPPNVPSAASYHQFLRGRRGATPWRAVRDALLDDDTRQWAARQIEEIRAGLEVFADVLGGGGAIRTRGAVASQPATPSSEITISAAVLTPGGGSSGAVVFTVRTPPVISADGRFRFEVSTDAADYDGRRVICTIALSTIEALSFEGVIARGESRAQRVVLFEDQQLPASGCRIPIDRVTLAIA